MKITNTLQQQSLLLINKQLTTCFDFLNYRSVLLTTKYYCLKKQFMLHIIILYTIILVQLLYLLKQKLNTHKTTLLLDKLPINREMIKEIVPDLVEYHDKEAFMKQNDRNKDKMAAVIKYEMEIFQKQNPILFISFNTLPLSLRDYSFLILVNDSLSMKGGKIISQISHGFFNLFYNEKGFGKTNPLLEKWIQSGQAKILLKGDELEIMKRIGMAKMNQVPFYIVNDAGRTQVAPGSMTVAFIGPWFVFVNKKISKGLSLL